MPIPGKLVTFDNCEKWFMTTCIGGDMLSNIVVCLVSSI